MTRPKPTAEVILATENGDPLLAWWRYGLGMSVAFTSDAKARWAAEWLSWPQFGQFWAQVVRHALRRAETKGSLVQVERKGSKAVVSIDAIEPSGKFLNRATTELTLVDPQLATRKIAMAQVAPGRYQAEIDTTRQGSYQLMFSQTKDSQVARPPDARAGRGLSRTSCGSGRRTPSCSESIAGATREASSTRSPSRSSTSRSGPPAGRAAVALPGLGRGLLCSCSMWPCAGSI